MRATVHAAATRPCATTYASATVPVKERRSVPLLSATGPVQERNRDVNDPAAGAHTPLTGRSRGRSRLGSACRCGPGATRRSGARAHRDLPQNRAHFCRERRRADAGLSGSDGARQGCPHFVRRCAALTRAIRSRWFGQLSECRRNPCWPGVGRRSSAGCGATIGGPASEGRN